MSRAGADAVKHTVRRTREQQVRVSESRGKVGGQLVASVKARNAHSRVHVLNSVQAPPGSQASSRGEHRVQDGEGGGPAWFCCDFTSLCLSLGCRMGCGASHRSVAL